MHAASRQAGRCHATVNLFFAESLPTLTKYEGVCSFVLYERKELSHFQLRPCTSMKKKEKNTRIMPLIFGWHIFLQTMQRKIVTAIFKQKINIISASAGAFTVTRHAGRSNGLITVNLSFAESLFLRNFRLFVCPL